MRLLHRIFLIVINIIPFDVLGALVFDLLQNFIVILIAVDVFVLHLYKVENRFVFLMPSIT